MQRILIGDLDRASAPAVSGVGVEAAWVWAAGAELGESPCWDYRSHSVFWVDIGLGAIHAFDLAGRTCRSWQAPGQICSLGVPPDHWTPPKELRGIPLVGCGAMGFVWIGVEADALQVIGIAHPERDRIGNRFNDGKVGPDGRYWAGTMDELEARPSGGLYALTADGSCATLDTGYRVSNGPAFSPDGSVVYHTDSALREIYAFDLNCDGRLSDKRVLVRFTAEDGRPDGMTTDGEGHLWVAIWDGARLEKLSPHGERLGTIPIPTPRPTSCTFIDSACRDMFVTSASAGVSTHDPLAGGLFRVQLT